MAKNSQITNIKLKILFWNAQIPRILKDLDILVCVESWLQPEHNIHYPGLLTFRKDRTHARGGAYFEVKDLTWPEQNIEILNLMAIYRAPDSTLSLYGDFNSHNIIWNCNRNDKNSKRLESCISNSDLFLLNSSNLVDKIDVYACDITMKKKTFKIKSLRTDWAKFESIINDKYEQFLTTQYDILWDEECSKIIRLRKTSYKKWGTTTNLQDLIEYKKNYALVKKKLKQKKKDNLKKFAESLNFRSNPNYVRNKSKILKDRFTKITPSHKHENLQNQQKVEVALNKISTPYVQTDPHWIPHCDDNTFLNHPFDFVEFNVALESKNKNLLPAWTVLTLTLLTGFH
ncbi:hypothetical protein TSAR_008012 [Trichomalopsis sarcophagae]|uniref:Endonuclease/exonuclease/phosphatase domain-containing protein n=1 Tax=Trichomalopsis sarcophagae TaxID=543379 RepID=A0A232FP39_9HYME|nr:hypothetical protein TSAR_008012 [Trichomalopsis sarcophagae]